MSSNRYWLHDELFRTLASSLAAPSRRAANVFPPVNLFDDGNNFVVRTELPGINKDSLDVTVKGDELTVKGERVIRVANASYHRREREGGSFHRTISLPEAIDGEKIQATYKHGVLEIMLPRVPKAQPRRIEIN